MQARKTIAALPLTSGLLPGLAMATPDSTATSHPCVGLWITNDGQVRHELLANARYDEARGNRESAYQGSCRISGNQIDHVDDTGFSADAEFIDDALYQGGMVQRRKSSRANE